jgi:superfamily II DNA or RNA helicase
MTIRLSHSIASDGVRLCLLESKFLTAARNLPFGDWPKHVAKPAMRSLRSLIERGEARQEGDELLLPHPLVADLPSALADQLGLPPLGAVSLEMRFEGRIETPEGRIRVRWADANYRSGDVVRTGAILRISKEIGRLSDRFYRLAEAIDRFNATAGGDIEARIAAWAPIQEELGATTGERIEADAFMKSLRFYQAGSFALDVVETENGPDFTPILMSRSKIRSLEDDAPTDEIEDKVPSEDGTGKDRKRADLLDNSADALLPPELHRQFVERNFNASTGTRDAYVLGRNTYVVLERELKAALDVVRQKRRVPAEERRAFLRNPRLAIGEALSAAGLDATSLFIETQQYSDRVEGIGVWEDIKPEPRQSSIDWIPEKFGEGGQLSQAVTPENVEEIARTLEHARAAGDNQIDLGGKKMPVAEVEEEVARVRERLRDHNRESAGEGEKEPKRQERIGLIIKNNINNVEYRIHAEPREPLITGKFPYDLLRENKPKEHQVKGFEWLIDAWTKGWPGVLLADDMGLGKTYQALVFLAWIRANLITRGKRYPTASPLGPLLVVAPTALLRNWLNEADTHLKHEGLGQAVEAFGSGLKKLKRAKGPGWTEEEALDIEELRRADWILTTYETLADYHRAFARVPYAVAVFDEMQKIKEPGSINARSSKTINADFVMGLTGTPIENRIEDLWAIFDRIAPGYLGALRDFSNEYGANDPERLKALKTTLDQPRENLPAPMLRRMKDKARDGLPEKRIETYPAPMPAPQADAYRRVVEKARDVKGSRSRMLEILQHMRGISLHPARANADISDPHSIDAWLKGSARTAKSVEILQEIEARGEKALVFIEDLCVQRAFAESIAAVFDLPRIPAIINGGVPGGARQEIVDRFQKAPPGFDVLLLSPKAAGIGLTITAANHVLHLSRWWNPAVEDQCNDRAYRIGATRDVTIHIPLAIHPDFRDHSFDVKLNALLDRKRALSREMLCPPESKGDVDELFNGVASD